MPAFDYIHNGTPGARRCESSQTSMITAGSHTAVVRLTAAVRNDPDGKQTAANDENLEVWLEPHPAVPDERKVRCLR